MLPNGVVIKAKNRVIQLRVVFDEYSDLFIEMFCSVLSFLKKCQTVSCIIFSNILKTNRQTGREASQSCKELTRRFRMSAADLPSKFILARRPDGENASMARRWLC